MSENCFHTIQITGNLIFESKHQNFRTALHEYLSDPDNQGGVQLAIKSLDTKNSQMEDIVVSMNILKMKQNPQCLTVIPREQKKLVNPEKPKPKLKRTPLKDGTSLVKNTENGDVDLCFY